MEVKANVPIDAFYKVWHMAARMDQRYYIADLITDILGGGGSSRLYQALVKEQNLFSYIDCSHHGTVDAGLLSIEGKLVKGVKMENAEKAIGIELKKLQDELVPENELQKVKNKTESTIAFEDMSVMNRANSLAMYELLGDAALMNSELQKYQAVTAEDIRTESRRIFDENNSNTLFYYAN